MKYLLDSVQMKAADRYTIEVKKIPSISLMERAARAAAEEISKLYQGHGEILVVCGSGNNGGDGFAAARFLKERGYRVRVVFVGKKEKRTIETSAQWDLCEKAKIKIQTEIGDAIFAVVADAVFGIGLSRELRPAYLQLRNPQIRNRKRRQKTGDLRNRFQRDRVDHNPRLIIQLVKLVQNLL